MSSELHGAALGHGQELNQIVHPHLDLRSIMVHIPQIKPCDIIVWYCDGEFEPSLEPKTK